MNMPARHSWAKRKPVWLAALSTVVAISVALGLTAGSAGAARASAASAATTAPPPLAWSGPQPLEKAPYQFSYPLGDISCPSAHFCITDSGVDEGEPTYGTVLTSTDPAGGASAWSGPRLAFRGSVSSGFSCPTTNFCAQISEYGVYTSTAPANGKPWLASHGSPGFIDELSCPSARLCVAAGPDGEIFTSTDPGAGKHASWHEAVKHAIGTIEAVSCPADSFCVAVSNGGYVVTSSHPANGASAWKATDLDGSVPLISLTCPSVTFCLAQDGADRFLYATDPAGGVSRWHAVADPFAPGLTDLKCTSNSFCAALFGGHPVWSTDPIGGASAWSQSQVTFSQSPAVDLSCASESFCAISTGNGYVLTSSDPTSSAPTWTPADIDGWSEIEEVDCAGAGLCLAADGDGHLFTSTDPTGGPGKWRAADVSASSITCPTSTFCAALGGAGLEISDDPNGGTSAWQSVTAPAGLSGLTCPSPSLCVAAGLDSTGDGVVYTSTDPAAGASAWQAADLGSEAPGGLALTCLTATFCVGTTGTTVLTSTDPTGGATAWQITPLAALGFGGFAAMQCPSTHLCVALGETQDPNGGPSTFYVVNSTDPTGGITAWHLNSDPVSGYWYFPDELDCPSTSECYQFSEGQGIWTSTNPSAAHPSWLFSSDTTKLFTVSCGTVSLCVGSFQGGYRGGIQVGTPPHPGAALAKLTVSANRLTYGHETREHLTATVSPAYPQYTAVPAGRIVIASRKQTLCRLTLKRGRASCTLSRDQLTPGSYWLRIQYAGDRAYAASQSATIKVTVVR